MRDILQRIPLIGPAAAKLYRKVFLRLKPFPGSRDYWVQRYEAGGDSGAGSYNRLAAFKAEVLNAFVQENRIESVIEYGCGDGNQLRLADYPAYLGFDVSPRAISLCREIFRDDRSKEFRLTSEYRGETAQLTLSLDVIYHLIEDDVYQAYMQRLFDSSERFVIVYSSDFEAEQEYHEKRRKFTVWVEANRPNWNLIRHIPNRYPYNGSNRESSLSDFYIYEKA